MTASRRALRCAFLAPMAALALTGCVSFGEEPPERLLTLTATSTAPGGTSGSGNLQDAIVVLTPDAPRMLDVARVPVQVDASSVAYLKDAVWVEKPTQLFARLLTETLRSQGSRFVVNGADAQYAAATRLSGQLLAMGYDAPSHAAVVRFDAMLQQADGTIRTQRFEARVDGVAADAAQVGPALNEAANKVAAEVVSWVG